VTHLSDWAVSRSQPTAVRVAGLSARARRDGIRIGWQTESGAGLLGFRLYRARTSTSRWVQLTRRPIPATAPGRVHSRRYRWIDRKAQPGSSYWYRLTAIDLKGAEMPLAVTHARMPAQR
jgi:hypothetical protein